MIYTVTCNPALDYTIYVPALTIGSIHRGIRDEITCGGKGINVSTVLAELDLPTTALGFVGGFTGAELSWRLQEAGILCDFIEVEGDTRINVKVRDGRETDINAAGPSVDDAAVEELIDKAKAAQAGDVLVLAGSIPAGIRRDLYERLCENAAKCGVLTVVDAEGELLLGTLRHRPFLIKPNAEELGGLFHTQVSTAADVEYYARELQRRGAKNVLVSLGAEGALLVDETGVCHRMAPPSGTVVNTVGCGDSMVAGFLTGWIRTRSYTEALRWGVACGSATAFSATLATREEIDAMIANL